MIPLRDVPENRHECETPRDGSVIIVFCLRSIVGRLGLFGQRQSVAVAKLWRHTHCASTRAAMGQCGISPKTHIPSN